MVSRRARHSRRTGNPKTTARPTREALVRKVLKKPLAALTTVLVAAVMAVVTTQAPQWFDQIGDHSERLDELRAGPEIRTTVTKVYLDDEGRTMATAQGHQPDLELRDKLDQPGAAADQDVLDRLERSGGVRVEALTLRLILEGRRNQQIRITDIVPEVVERSEPLAGTLFFMPAQGGEPSLSLLLDLDQIHPVAREVAEDSTPFDLKPGPPYFDANTISLKEGEQQVVVMRVRTQHSFFTFRIRIDYQIGGQPKSITVDDAGKPFTITALHPGPEPGTLSYEHAFWLNGDFSLCEITGARRLTEDTTC